jgi:putative DNA primase/helicase
VSDARLGSRADTHQVVERLLSISGEDMLTIDRKYREPWTGKLPSRFLVISNELPNFGDASGAIANRFVVLALTKSFLGKENTGLTDELLLELPGILGWALEGLDRLRRQGKLTEPKSSADAITDLHDTVSPTSAFVRDYCEVGPEYEVRVDLLYGEWRRWCDTQGRDRPGPVQTFGRNLRAVLPGLQITQPRDGDARERRYVGLRIKSAQQ